MLIRFLCLVTVLGSVYASPTSLKSRTKGTTYAGVNIAGFDFGCLKTDGSCTVTGAVPPLSDLSNGKIDGVGQMQHFFKNRGLNLFRLPVAWQYLTEDNSFDKLDSDRFSNYDKLVQGCLSTGARCIVDIHNYARYDGAIIGQSEHGPTNKDFANLWTQIAKKYKGQSKIVYGIMNEPHDLKMDKWAVTVQEAVKAIRATTGNNDNLILLPGTAFTSVGAFASQSFPALSKVKNPDGSFDNLIFDVHQYLDPGSGGKRSDCDTDGTDELKSLQKVLVGRQALLSETGGGPKDKSCITHMCAQIAFLNKHPDQFLGYAAWSAGSFQSSYELDLVPTKSGGVWTDAPLMMKCLARR